MAITIYPDTVNGYKTLGNANWSSLRDGNSSVVQNVDINNTVSAHRISDEYVFVRTYMQFDLSSITAPITNMRLYVYGQSVLGSEVSSVVFGGQNALNNNATDYSLYLNNLIDDQPLADGFIIQQDSYNSTGLNISTYPPSYPLGYYVIGIVADRDFLNLTNELFAEITINNTTNPPYLSIETSTGYPYNVNGVPAASIGEVSGVLSSNIVNIIGV
jgi:hypothetical protein